MEYVRKFPVPDDTPDGELVNERIRKLAGSTAEPTLYEGGEVAAIYDALNDLATRQLIEPKINSPVPVTATSEEINQLDGRTVGGALLDDIVTQRQLQTAAMSPALPPFEGNAGKCVTTDGTNTFWGFVGGGATHITVNSDVQLAADSPRKMAVTSTVPGVRIRLPLTTELEQDGTAFIISNSGPHTIRVVDYDNHTLGAALGGIKPSEARLFLVVDKDAGTWAVLKYEASSLGGRIGEAGFIVETNTPVVFESANTNYISATALSDTKVLVAYRDDGNSNSGTAVVLDIAGSSIVAGTPVVFESGVAGYIPATALSDTKVLVAYRDDGNSNSGTAVVLDIAGSSIVVGTPVAFGSASPYHISATALSDTKVLVAYRDDGNSNSGTAVVLDIAGSSIVAGTPVVFESGVAANISATALSDTKVLVAYRDDGNSNSGTAVVLDIAGSSIVAGTPVVFESGVAGYISATALSDTKVLVAYRDAGTSSGKAVVLTIAGSSIVAGTPVVFESGVAGYISATTLSDTKVLVAYQGPGGLGAGHAIVLGVTGSEISSMGSSYTFSEFPAAYISTTALSDLKIVVAYQDDGGDGTKFGTAQVLDRR